MKYDFCGYATRYNVKCSDGRTIRKDAFAHCDGITVPLMFQHGHNDVDNIVGNCLLESRSDGMYCYGSFNETLSGDTMKQCVEHGDITSLSIYANHLQQNSSLEVFHGDIREVSLVLTGANRGAYIEDINIEHTEDGESEAIIYTDASDCEFALSHGEESVDSDTPDYIRVIDTMNEDQKKVLASLVSAASKGELDLNMSHSDEEEVDEGENEEYEEYDDDVDEEDGEEYEEYDDEDDEDEDEEYDEDEDEEDEEYDEEDYDDEDENDEGGNEMKRNVFEAQTSDNKVAHADFAQIVQDAVVNKSTLSDSILMHAEDYGVQNIEDLFPDPKDLNMPPEWIKPENAWVPVVLNGVSHTPFSRVRTRFADITADEARAKGYVKGNRKKEEVFALLKRETTPCTIYKKQKLDRDDIIDITDFDIVPWIKNEMQMMLDLERALAILVGDGRDAYDEDKIPEDHIRPIWKDDELYTIRRQVYFPENATDTDKTEILRETILRSRKDYKGSGNLTLFCSPDWLTTMLLAKDGFNRPLYKNDAEVASALRVSKIVEVPQFDDRVYTDSDNNEFDLVALLVNLSDYKVGADRGGKTEMFDDFDIDFNQYKYLLECRFSGALTKVRSAIVVEASHYPMLKIGVEAAAPNVDLLGKTASELQSGIRVNDLGEIRGTLKYVTNYDGFEQGAQGNFIGLKIDVEDGSTTTVEILGGTSGPSTLDSDCLYVGKIANKQQKIRIVTTKDGSTNTAIYSLKYINLEAKRS
ncbi:MAG: phage major capsid protein [Clostridiales bacterium]|nr:phage major capsid protein [Clostridiales bacterium]